MTLITRMNFLLQITTEKEKPLKTQWLNNVYEIISMKSLR